MRTAVSSARLGPATERGKVQVLVTAPTEARCAYPGLSHLHFVHIGTELRSIPHLAVLFRPDEADASSSQGNS